MKVSSLLKTFFLVASIVATSFLPENTFANTISTGSVSSPLCGNASFLVPYSINGTFNAGNVFTAELSDASGNFSAAVSIGTLSSTNAGSIPVTIPPSTPAGSGYRIRVSGSNPITTGADNGADLVVFASPSVSCSVINPESYPGANDGSVNVSATGGTPPYTGTGTFSGLAAGTYTYVITDAGGCSASCQTTVGSGCIPSTPGLAIIPSDTAICLGSSVTLSVSGGSLGTLAYWSWSEGACATGTTVGQGTTIQLTPSTAAFHKYYVRAVGPCGMTTCDSIVIRVKSLVTLPTISITSFPASACVGGTGTITTNTVAGATGYYWTGTTGILFNGQPGPYTTNTPSVSVSFVSLPPANGLGWNVCVYAFNSNCGKSNNRCTTVKAVPPAPSIISGNAISCPLTSSVYSITPTDGAVSYSWTITGGNTTLNSGGTSVTTLVPNVTVNFGAAFSSGQLCVTATNACGVSSAARCKNITGAPLIPGAISGPTTICSGSTVSYSIVPVSGATAYTWSVTGTGISFTGSGTTVAVSTLPSFTNGSICVYAQGACPAPAGNSPLRCKTLGTGKLPTPGNISGNPPYGACNDTLLFSIPSMPTATGGYGWTLPPGVLGSSTGNSIVAIFPDTFTIGQVCVHGVNSCGAGFDRCLVVYGSPPAPVAINGNAAPCVGQEEVYTWTAATGATQYHVIFPAGVYILTPNPTSDNYAVINWNRIQSGTLAVEALNSCGVSGTHGLSINPVSCRLAGFSENAPPLIPVKVFPNPASSFLTVELTTEKNISSCELALYEPSGRRVEAANYALTIGTNRFDVKLTHLSEGVYFLVLKVGDEFQRIRIIRN